MEGIIVTVALMLVVLGLLSVFAGPSPEAKRLAEHELRLSRGGQDPPGKKKAKTKAAVKKAKSSKAKDPASAEISRTTVAEPAATAGEVSPGPSEHEEEEEEEGADFLGLEDVLPSNRGVYMAEGRAPTAEDQNESLFDGWETVDAAKYNIPRGHKVTSQGLTLSDTAYSYGDTGNRNRPAGGSCNSTGNKKSKNERRREKEQLARSALHNRTPASSVAERMGTKGTKRVQKEPGSHAAVPGM